MKGVKLWHFVAVGAQAVVGVLAATGRLPAAVATVLIEALRAAQPLDERLPGEEAPVVSRPSES